MSFSPKASRRNVHFKEASQKPNLVSYNAPSNVNSAHNSYPSPAKSNKQPANKKQSIKEKSRGGSPGPTSAAAAQPQPPPLPSNPNPHFAAQQQSGVTNLTTRVPYVAHNTQLASAANTNAGFVGSNPAIPPAVLAYIKNNQCPSFVPNARFAYEMYHSLKTNLESNYSNYEEDMNADQDEDDEDIYEEEDYDQLISCSEWGDISEIS